MVPIHIHHEISKNAEAALVLPANSEDESSLEGFLPKSDFSKDDFRLPFWLRPRLSEVFRLKMLEMLEKGGVGVLDSLRGAGDLLPYPLVPLWSSQFEVSNPLFDEDSDDLLPVNTNNDKI